MSIHFGPIFQTAYITPDFDQALDHWTRVMGVGPFYLFPVPVPFTSLIYRGQALSDYNLIAQTALAYSGDTQIELILPGSAPSPYHEFLKAGHQGVQHLGTVARDFDAQLAAAQGAGIGVAMQGALPGFRFAYLDTDAGRPGTMIELIELGPEAQAMMAMIKQASIGWDGHDPVRKI